MRDLADSVRELCNKAGHLAQRSNELSDLIEGLNDSLSEADLGVALWLDEPFFTEDGVPYFLGWARSGTDLQLAVLQGEIADDGDIKRDPIGTGAMSLLSSRQGVRIAASQRLHELVQKLREVVERRSEGLKSIETDLDGLPDHWRKRSMIHF
jgi:hypothetical protein